MAETPPSYDTVHDETEFDRLVAEVSARIEKGDSLDLDRMTADCPEHRDRLARLLPTLRAVAQFDSLRVDSASRGAVPPPHAFESVEGNLGDFRIIRELGRGGMGIVYEAHQRSLSRRVALKVLPLAATLNASQLQRFQNEARAAASLRHPNIVGVFSVGVERGVHYYAMELVEGRSLAEVLVQLRESLAPLPPSGNQHRESSTQHPPSSIEYPASSIQHPPSSSAETAPNALLSTLKSARPSDYYRSIARLAIQAADALDYAHQMGIIHRDIKPSNLLLDNSAHLWVTDFGLAITQADSGLTMTGDILGTLRYMSPEQAAGKRLPVDHRTDIYSLGITLYELLAKRPPFESNDRAELLRAIAEVEPPALRRAAPSVPIDLETIVHKAMQKDAADRYATAAQLRDDLAKFLENRPIVARPPTALDRLTKWSRRHVAAIWIASLMLLAATVVLGGTLFLITQARDEAVAARAAAENEAERAKRNLALAIESLDRLYTELVGKHLANEPRLTRVRQQFLQEALTFYERIAAENKQDSLSWAETGRAWLIAGRIYTELDQPDKAGEAFEKSVQVFDTLIRRFPLETAYREQSAEATIEQAGTLIHMGFVEYAIELLGVAFHEIEPGGDPATDESLASQLQSPRHAELIATIYDQLGQANAMADKHSDSAEALRRALRIRRGLAERHPRNPNYRRALAGTLTSLALLHQKSGASADSGALIEEALAEQQAALRLAPREVASRRALRDIYHALGSIRTADRQTEAAIDAHRRGFELASTLADEYPEITNDRFALAFAHYSLAAAHLAAGQLEEANDHYQRSLATWSAMPKSMKKYQSFVTIYDVARYHPGAIEAVNQPDALTSFQRTIRRLFGKSPAEKTVAAYELAQKEAAEQSAEEGADASSGDERSQTMAELLDPEGADFDPFAITFDAAIARLRKNDRAQAAEILAQPVVPTAAISEFSQTLFGNTEVVPVIHLYIQSKELLIAHARALATLGDRLASAPPPPPAAITPGREEEKGEGASPPNPDRE